MANILITNECNLRCPYCFAEGVTCQEPEFMTEDQLALIIAMAKKTHEPLKILGGEPTIHPNFLKLCRMIGEYNQSIGGETTIFTNGILLHEYYKDLKALGGFNILVNVNDLSNLSDSIQENFNKSIEMVANDNFVDTNIGCNVHLGEQDYNYIFDLVDKYTFTENFRLRVSVVAPASNYKEFSASRKQEYYEAIKPIYINFLQKCKDRNIRVNFDCNQIPPCFLSYDEVKLLIELNGGTMPMLSCDGAPIDIDNNFNVWPCFGRKDETIDISEYMDCINFNMLRDQFTKNRKTADNCTLDKQVECILCTGGCASFKEENK